MTTKPVHVIGGGLAGSETSWQLAQAGVPVVLHEMRPVRGTEAHKTQGLAELVCSNSFRSDDAETNAVGVLHAEMRLADSLIMASGDANQVPAGGALAVDRDGFSDAVTARLEAHPLITIVREEVSGLPPADWDQAIIATGPLTAPSLAEAIAAETGADALAFFDAIAPIIHFDTIDMDVAWFQSRYDKVGPGGTGKDYINCPMDKAQYDAFIAALMEGGKTEFKQWEGTPYFDGCLQAAVKVGRAFPLLEFRLAAFHERGDEGVVLRLVHRAVDIVLAGSAGPDLVVTRLEPSHVHVDRVEMNDGRDSVEECERVGSGFCRDGFGKGGGCQRPGGDDRLIPVRRWQARHFFAHDGDERMGFEPRRHGVGEAVAVDGKRAACGHLVRVARSHDQRIGQPHLCVQHTHRIGFRIVGPEGVGADEFRQPLRLVRLRTAHRAHFVENHRHARLRELP